MASRVASRIAKLTGFLSRPANLACHSRNYAAEAQKPTSETFSLSTAANQLTDSPRDEVHSFSEVHGNRIFYTKVGFGNHQVICMPGALGSAVSDFEIQLKTMNRELFTFIAWDPRGYGKSVPPERDWPMDFLERDAEDAVRLMENLERSKYSLLGWSDGGIAAMFMAARYPERVRKMVIWGANAYLTEADIKLYDDIRDIDKWSDKMKKNFIEAYGEETFYGYFRNQWSNWVSAFGRFVTDRNGDICKEELKNIKCPTLIIHGKKDSLVAQEHAEYIHANIAGSRLEYFDEGKHNLHFKYKKEFNSMVEKFLIEPVMNPSK